MERERQQFLLQQEERQRRWHAEREELLQAQKKLDEVKNKTILGLQNLIQSIQPK